MRLSKLTNWFKNTDTDGEKSPQLTNLEEPQSQSQPQEQILQKLKTENQKLSDRLKSAQKRVAQVRSSTSNRSGFSDRIRRNSCQITERRS